MPADTPADRFRAGWTRVTAALAAEDTESLLPAVQEWISAWDECFWSNDLSPFEVAYHPDVEIVNSTRGKGLSLIKEGTGLHLLTEGRKGALDLFSWFGFAIQSVHRSENRLLALGSLRTRGRYSGIPMPVPLGALWTIRDGRISRVEGFTSRKKAFAALEATERNKQFSAP